MEIDINGLEEKQHGGDNRSSQKSLSIKSPDESQRGDNTRKKITSPMTDYIFSHEKPQEKDQAQPGQN